MACKGFVAADRRVYDSLAAQLLAPLGVLHGHSQRRELVA
jgi:hypothetical protein